jgi:hypothetical protein
MDKVTIVLVFCLLLTACGPGQVFGPTFTPTPKSTLTPTITSSPTSTLTPKITPLSMPSISCTIPDGKWESEEYYDGIPLFSFSVSKCSITDGKIWSFLAPAELQWVQIELIPIKNNMFTYEYTDQSGTYTMEGTFESEISAHGTPLFPKGLIIDYIVLPKGGTINWTAHPVQ